MGWGVLCAVFSGAIHVSTCLLSNLRDAGRCWRRKPSAQGKVWNTLSSAGDIFGANRWYRKHIVIGTKARIVPGVCTNKKYNIFKKTLHFMELNAFFTFWWFF